MKKLILSTLILIAGLSFSQEVLAYSLNPQTPTILGGDMHLVDSADFNNYGKNDLVVTDGKNMAGIGILYGKMGTLNIADLSQKINDSKEFMSLINEKFIDNILGEIFKVGASGPLSKSFLK